MCVVLTFLNNQAGWLRQLAWQVAFFWGFPSLDS